MPLSIATHNGPFHADDVMAVGLLRTFVDAEATVDRSRDPERWQMADVVVDVGGVFDAEQRRFDHHQASYEGPRSSAGMVLDWLVEAEKIDPIFAQSLRDGLMDYLDAVDNGRRAPSPEVPCFPSIIGALNSVASTQEGFDVAFGTATGFASALLEGLKCGYEKVRAAETVVVEAMATAKHEGRNVLFFDTYVNWKPGYFAHGGAEHPSEFVLFPGVDGSWRIVAIPPSLAAFAQKRSFPESWAGLTGSDLEAVTGISGAMFCHRNRFITVFQTRDAAMEALRSINFLMRT